MSVATSTTPIEVWAILITVFAIVVMLLVVLARSCLYYRALIRQLQNEVVVVRTVKGDSSDASN